MTILWNCDTCGTQEETKPGEGIPRGWAEVIYKSSDSAFMSAVEHFHICAKCMRRDMGGMIAKRRRVER